MFDGIVSYHVSVQQLRQVLAWEVNSGYQDLGNVEVLRVCGVRVHNLAHLAYLLTHATGRYVTLDLTWNKASVCLAHELMRLVPCRCTEAVSHMSEALSCSFLEMDM